MDFFLTGFALSDFAFFNGLNGTGGPLTIGPAENGPFGLGADGVASATLSPTAAPQSIFVSDDDANLDDFFQEAASGGAAPSVLTSPITIQTANGPVTFPAGDRVEAEFFFTADDGTQFIFVAVGGTTENAGLLNFVLSTRELVPGETLNFVASADGPSIAYQNIVCFVSGTMIATPKGEVPVEDLRAGDMVVTRDGGAKPLRWTGTRTVSATGRLAPVVFRESAIGNPRELRVSPLHRVLLTDWRAQLMFGTDEVLIVAKDLVNGDTIYQAEGGEVTYHHILFDRHEIVTANGVAAESFHPGETGLSILDEGPRAELLEIFPELRISPASYGKAARPSLKSWEVTALRLQGVVA